MLNPARPTPVTTLLPCTPGRLCPPDCTIHGGFLLSLPDEVIITVFRSLPSAVDRSPLAMTCKHLAHIAVSQQLLQFTTSDPELDSQHDKFFHALEKDWAQFKYCSSCGTLTPRDLDFWIRRAQKEIQRSGYLSRSWRSMCECSLAQLVVDWVEYEDECDKYPPRL